MTGSLSSASLTLSSGFVVSWHNPDYSRFGEVKLKGAEGRRETAGYAARTPADIKRVLGVKITSVSDCFPLCSKLLVIFSSLCCPLLADKIKNGCRERGRQQRRVQRKAAVL